jgi:hypothetical protein
MARTRLWTASVGLAVALTGGTVAAGSRPAGTCDVRIPDHVRVLDCRLAATLADGMARSPSLRDLVDRIRELQGIVYVSTALSVSPGGHHVLLGALSHQVAVAGPYRIMRITVRHDYDDRAVATIAHELRHAIEVLQDPAARSKGDVDLVFERIGYRIASGVMETEGAINVERTVSKELQASRQGPPAVAIRQVIVTRPGPAGPALFLR